MEKNILLNLDDKETGKVAEVLSNKTCKKILSYLVENSSTVSEISKNLKIPLNTAGYNIKKLKKTGLIKEKSHFWSEKNKRIPVYSVANKKIIISPKKSSSLKSSLPVVLISAIFTAFILFYEKSKSVNVARDTPQLLEVGKQAVSTASGFLGLGILEWFLILVWLAVAIFIVISVRRSR